MWETLPEQRSEQSLITVRSVAHLAEQVVGRPEDGSSREKAEAPAEVAAGAGSVEEAADAESHKKAPAELADAVSVEVSADEKTFFFSVAAEVAASVASAKGAAGEGHERLCPISGGGR